MEKCINLKDFINDIKNNYAESTSITDAKVINDIKNDYNNLIDLRNRVEYELDNTCAEDTITLDHTLDLVEILLKHIAQKENRINE